MPGCTELLVMSNFCSSNIYEAIIKVNKRNYHNLFFQCLDTLCKALTSTFFNEIFKRLVSIYRLRKWLRLSTSPESNFINFICMVCVCTIV